MLRLLTTACPMLLLLTVLGCETGAETAADGLSDEQVAQYRESLLLDDQPTEAQTVIEVRDRLTASGGQGSDGAPPAEEVTVTGVIGSMPNPYTKEGAPDFPWFKGVAAFALVDPTTVAAFGGHQHHDGEECMFCAAKAKKLANTVARVQLVDGEGKPVEARADRLLGLQEGATVTVTGTGSLQLGTLSIDAVGVFVEPEVAN